MRIALIGTPGSGKSEVAQGLAKVLWDPLTIIDEYVEALEDTIDLKLGFDATYIGNLNIALYRESLERQAAYRSAGSITCGTIYETACYSAMAFESEGKILGENQEDREIFSLRVDAMMRMLAALYMDLYRYDYAFYLPSNSGDLQIQALDKNLQAAFVAFSLGEVHTLGDDPVAEIQAIIPKNPVMAEKMAAHSED